VSGWIGACTELATGKRILWGQECVCVVVAMRDVHDALAVRMFVKVLAEGQLVAEDP
jgi:hypothetical protein